MFARAEPLTLLPFSRRCSVSENQTATQKERLESTTASLISAVQQTAQEAKRTVDECSGYCSHLHSSLTQLGEKSLQWCASTKDGIDSQAQVQLTLIRDQTASAQTLLTVNYTLG